uniref:WAP domain-containing protein n=1 Tax=Globodera pallida TaxID=36090 RepID=A0A183BZI6_GLOPA
MSRRAPSHQRRVMILPRIPVKPDRNASVVTAIPYQPRSPMGWCEYLKEVGIESPKCGERGAKVAGKGDNVTQKKRGKKRRKKKERIVVEWERTMEQDELEEEKRQKQLLMVTEEVQRRLQEEEEREQYRIEGVGNFPSCQGHFVRCRPSRECASGALCRSRISDARCCRRHADAQCPSTDQLGHSCLQKNPVNWCNLNDDCAANAFRSHICCPTGCGYNVCLSNVQQPPIRQLGQMEARTQLLSPDCPSPFEIRVKCVVPRPASWCHSSRECPTYSKAYPRRCCLTPFA